MLVDNFDKHIEDTMIAGDWISDRDAVEQVVRNAPEQIMELVNWGVNFDRNEKGEFFALGQVKEYENGTAIKAIKTFNL